MRQFVIKIIALENSLILWNAFANDEPISAWTVEAEVAGIVIKHKARNAAKSVASSTIRNSVKNKINNKDVIQTICSSTINDYDKILEEAIDDLGSMIKPRKDTNPINIVRLLITFDEGQLKKLMSMNKRLRFFYFFKVHEIISLLPPPLSETGANNITNDNEINMLLSEFNQLLKTTGDFDIYNNFFVSDITLEKLKEFTTIFKNDFPRDLTKLIVDYCHLSIHNKSDFNLILDRIILSNFS
jgi:hypothetical protein